MIEPAISGNNNGEEINKRVNKMEAAKPPMAVTSLKNTCICFWSVLYMVKINQNTFIYFFALNQNMVSGRALSIINISLGLLSILLIMMLLGVELPTLGKAQYALDQEEPLCIIKWEEEATPFQDIDRCCLQARQQFECQAQSKDDLDWMCGREEGLQIWLNNKAYNYCKQQPYW